MSLKLVVAETIGIDEKTLNELAKDILPNASVKPLNLFMGI